MTDTMKKLYFTWANDRKANEDSDDLNKAADVWNSGKEFDMLMDAIISERMIAFEAGFHTAVELNTKPEKVIVPQNNDDFASYLDDLFGEIRIVHDAVTAIANGISYIRPPIDGEPTTSEERFCEECGYYLSSLLLIDNKFEAILNNISAEITCLLKAAKKDGESNE